MTKDPETAKTETGASSENRPIGESFLHGLNERLRVLTELQQSQKDGFIQLPPKTNQEIEAEIKYLKRNAEKMEKQFAKIESKLPKTSSKVPPQNSERG